MRQFSTYSCIFSGSHNIFSTFSSTCLQDKFKNQSHISELFLDFFRWNFWWGKPKDLLLIRKFVCKKKGSSREIVNGQIFEEAANLWTESTVKLVHTWQFAAQCNCSLWRSIRTIIKSYQEIIGELSMININRLTWLIWLFISIFHSQRSLLHNQIRLYKNPDPSKCNPCPLSH